MLDDILDWLGEAWDFITRMFEGLSELSMGGLAFGMLTTVFIFALRGYMLNPFLVHMGPMEALFWGGATYVGGFIGGYLIGKNMLDD